MSRRACRVVEEALADHDLSLAGGRDHVVALLRNAPAHYLAVVDLGPAPEGVVGTGELPELL